MVCGFLGQRPAIQINDGMRYHGQSKQSQTNSDKRSLEQTTRFVRRGLLEGLVTIDPKTCWNKDAVDYRIV